MGNKVSMQQIADMVGLSKYAVSKALAGKGGVSAKTRERIIETATQLGYFKQQKALKNTGESPNQKAGGTGAQPSEAGARSVVAVLMPNVRLQNMESGFWGVIVNGIGFALSRLNLGMLILTEQTAEQLETLLKPERLIGVIGVGEISTSMLLEVQRLGLPFVLTDHEDSLVPSDTVFASNMDSMAALTGHLLALGHSSFWFLGDTGFSRSFADRWMGYRKALEEQDIQVDPRTGRLPLSGTDREGNIRFLQELLDGPAGGEQPMPTAWVCANDEIALAALTVLEKKGLKVPEEVSVTGFDDIGESRLAKVPLTTVHVKKVQLGERAVAALLDRAREPDKPFEKISLACELVIRSSAAGQK
ncbi:MAG: LacI family transcriptional regulator [Paenibacillaceae bacterium]|nr:LacI family transcriptional regulator [Paenibacillaceae bacterium]